METIKLINPNFSGEINRYRHACRGILVKDDKILIGYGKKEDFYIIPGGGIEEGETLIECCIREVLEETGIVCIPTVNYLDIDELFLDMNHINHYFICEIKEENHKTNFTKDEIAAELKFEWMDIDEILNIFSEYDKYKDTDNPRFGLYRREYFAIKTYLEFNKHTI